MSIKTINSTPKISCERFKKHLRAHSVRCNNKLCILENTCPSSTKETRYSNRNKSLSAGILTNKTIAKPKKTTKSDLICNENHLLKLKVVDCNKHCGDTLNTIPIGNNSTSHKKLHSMTATNKICSKHTNTQNGKKLLKQFYRNVNYQQSTESMHSADYVRTCNLNPIKEQQEMDSNSISNSVFEILSDSEPEEAGDMDPTDYENIRNLKQFREQNYFECHSAKSRIQTKGSVTSLNNHQCVYRFYLNDRLFPVPLNTDYNKNIRCIECHLPLQDSNCNPENSNINGTIQAKVRLNNEVQDMMLMLPVNKSLIVRERRKELEDKKEEDFVYFGIIKLNLNGDSIFNQNMPSNSLALKYQKGYKEYYIDHNKYEYESLGKNDVIII